jgi:ribosome-associated toxin RatA of RatAB toxin-antitoxin module
MHTSISVTVAAPPARVFELARDITRWPELLPHYRRVSVHARRDDRVVAQMVAVRRVGPIGIPVTWRAEQWSEGTDPNDLRLRFRHVRGVTRGMDVTWHIRPDRAGACVVTIVHDFRRPLPLLGADTLPFVVDRLFTRAIAGRTLSTFKSLAEAGSSPADGAAGRHP